MSVRVCGMGLAVKRSQVEREGTWAPSFQRRRLERVHARVPVMAVDKWSSCNCRDEDAGADADANVGVDALAIRFVAMHSIMQSQSSPVRRRWMLTGNEYTESGH